MAAYAAAVTLPDLVAKKVASTGLGILRGSVNVTNYNQTLAEITDITGRFRSAPTVILENVSSNGYLVRWDTAAKSIKAYYPTNAVTPAGTISKPTFTVEAAGAIGTNMEVGLSVDTAAATFEGGTGITAQRVLTTTSPVGTPTFTGTAVVAGAGTQVASDVDLGTVAFIALGPAP